VNWAPCLIFCLSILTRVECVGVQYIPPTILEMKKSYSHVTPLATMNFLTTMVNILEGCIKPENLSSKAEQV
jgi:hypothetical protein